jgi:hypothetical protein
LKLRTFLESALKYEVGVVPNAFLNMEMNARRTVKLLEGCDANVPGTT